EEKYITFEKSILQSDEGNHAKDTLWVQMLEKAYAIHKKAKAEEDDAATTAAGPVTGSYVKIGAGGDSSDIFEAFLGRPCSAETIKGSGNLGNMLKELRDMVPDAMSITKEDAGKIKKALVEKGFSKT